MHIYSPHESSWVIHQIRLRPMTSKLQPLKMPPIQPRTTLLAYCMDDHTHETQTIAFIFGFEKSQVIEEKTHVIRD